MRTGWKAAAILILVTGAVACTDTPDRPNPDPTVDRLEGQSEFESPSDGSGPSRNGAQDDAEAGAPNEAPTAPTNNQNESAPERLIEESDIYKIEGNTLYVLNRYRGLQIIDISNLDAPRLVGKAPIYGWPKEMYVREGKAYVIVSDYYSFWRVETADGEATNGFHGSQVRVVDLADPTAPQVVGGIDVEGEVTDSRIVGEVLYLVSRRWSWYWHYDTNDNQDTTVVLSIDLSNPAAARVVDEEKFPMNGWGWEQHIAVNQRAIYVATPRYESADYRTDIRYVDISDAGGNITTRGNLTVPGRVMDRWSMDEHEGALRVASGQSWGNGDVYLTTWNVTNPDALAPLGAYTLHVDERLTSARFDADRGYLVSYRNIDPLFSFDLADPRHPTLLGELEMTGWLDFMVPMGDRIVALGHEDVTTPQGGRDISLSVSLIDVGTDHPQLLSRVVMDGAWGWVPGERDDFAKVFKVLSGQGLVVFPFQAWSRNDWRYVGGVQLIDFSREALTRRGLIRDAGWVERAVPHGDTTVLTIANELFQIMDITNRDQPRLRGRLELARNVQDFALVGGTHTVQLSGDWYLGDTSLVVTPKADPDAATPTSSVRVPAPYGRMFTNGNFAYVASMREGTNGAQTTIVQVVDLTNPAAPRIRGTVELPEPVSPGYRSWYWGWGDESVLVNGTTLALHRYRYSYWYEDCVNCGARPEDTHRIYLVDLANPDAPTVASSMNVDANWAWGLKAAGSKLYMSEYESVRRGDRYFSRYYLHGWDVTNPAAPADLGRVNIPGQYIGSSADGRYVYTLESWWDRNDSTQHSRLYALEVGDGRAYLRSFAELDGYLSNLQVTGTTGVATTQVYGYETDAGNQQRWYSRNQLVTVDLADPRALRVAGSVAMPIDWGWLQKVVGTRAFVSTYYGLFTYDVSNAARPTFQNFFRTQGWVQDVVVDGTQAFLPSGYYGVQKVDLTGNPQ